MAKIWANRLISGATTWSKVPAARKNAVKAILEGLVEAGELTQEQLDAILAA